MNEFTQAMFIFGIVFFVLAGTKAVDVLIEIRKLLEREGVGKK